MKVLPEGKGTSVHYVVLNDSMQYKCLTKKRAEAIKEMAEALVCVYQDLKACDDWGNDIGTTTIEKVIVSLNKFGINV